MARRWSTRVRALACALLVAASAPGSARADEPASETADAPAGEPPANPNRKVAEGLFREGKTLLDLGQLEQACRVLEQSNELEPAGGTLLNLASCNERLGRYASAERALEAAAVLAERAERADAREFIQQRLAAVRPNVSILEIRIPPKLLATQPGLEVDGARAKLARSIELRVDPGAHEIVLDRGGQPFWKHSASVAGAGKRVVVEIPDRRIDEPAPLQPPPSPELLTPFGIALATLGGALIVGGAVTGGLAVDAWSDASARCPDPQCADEVGVARASEAKDLGDATTGLLAAGGGALVTGVILILVPRLSGSTSASGAPVIRF